LEKKNLQLAIKLRHELHQHPELSNHEVWTKQRLIDFLKKHTNLEIVDKGHWFYAIYRAGEGKKNIAFRADFDALPIEETIDIPHASKNREFPTNAAMMAMLPVLPGLRWKLTRRERKKIFFSFFSTRRKRVMALLNALTLSRKKISTKFLPTIT
jgi:hypothetical protein